MSKHLVRVDEELGQLEFYLAASLGRRTFLTRKADLPHSEGACGNMDKKGHRVNLIDRGGYLYEKYRVPKRLIEDLLLLATASTR